MPASTEKLWADFYDWPQRWAGISQGCRLRQRDPEIYKPFVEELLLRHSLSTVKRHLDNLWLLGGELIRSWMDTGGQGKDPDEIAAGQHRRDRRAELQASTHG